MRQLRRAGLALAAPVLAAALIAAGPVGGRATASQSASPRAARLAPAFSGLLDGVAATSASNAWFVGNDDANKTLIVHWNGHAWARVAAPNPSPTNDTLTSISAVSARDIWAVGAANGAVLILHWNGKAWRRVASPAPGEALGVVALSATNAWAVGGTGGGKALIEHWNGHAWRSMPVPAPKSAELQSVSASAAGNVWAVGIYLYGNANSKSGVLIVHWNGKTWRRVAAVNPFDSHLTGVSVLSATNAWAVGSYTNGTLTTHTLIEHWNGKAWTRAASPNPPEGAEFWAVAARSASLAFAVGDTTPAFPNIGGVYIQKWNGHAWREVTSPPQPAGFGFGVGFGSARSAWIAALNETSPLNPTTLIEHWNGARWG
jgi:hypothetical protein